VAGKAGEILKIEQYWGNLLKIPVIPLNSDWFERASPRIILAAIHVGRVKKTHL
ncbi:hypothetical protein MJN85_29725, partial [Salmonella enterica subsp. enterica serovar Anatum]|nr:hypothetical protein [Salmonella enterica subsp. enterica serovar Anatum]